jgi:hypothetical protein
VVCSCFTGIGALLLPNGATLHHVFQLPLKLHELSSSNMDLSSNKARILKHCAVIIIDEVSMLKKLHLQIINVLLQNILRNELPFGGKIVLLGGDFRQLLPVVKGETQAIVASHSVVNSDLWQFVQKHTLTQNQRAITDPAFCEFLLTLGDGRHQRVADMAPDVCELPAEMMVSTLNNLIAFVFEEDYDPSNAILAPTNAVCSDVNNLVISRMPGQFLRFYSQNSYLSTGNVEERQLDTDELTVLTPSGMPPHELCLKVNCSLMLLRNLDMDAGLCNGTILKLLDTSMHVLTCEIAQGEHAGEIVYLPRIRFECEDNPIPFSRTQFPVRVAFCRTINKSQGQTLNRVGLYLEQTVFSHGQIYVALSRATCQRNVKVCIPRNRFGHGYHNRKWITRNVVNYSILEM